MRAELEIIKLDSNVLTSISCPSDCLSDGGEICPEADD